MPSRFEPCGLSQMYAQRFGSLPIGHQTGGLAETITDGETGFLFSQPSIESFLGGVRRAFSAFVSTGPARRHAPQRHGALVQLGPVGRALQRALPQDGVGLKPFAGATRRVSGISSAIIDEAQAPRRTASPRKATLLPNLSLT